ncbi:MULTISPECIES: NUDIX domain-containing protein [unclassified Sphingomonas]|uniref:NUDIX domain-containing protein n=1 Tax=unclassified Sphingomonas TaxID=196159 RepID=UPI00082D0260|nr:MULTISPECIES: NUDIX domain-containing protein [unclassified Sphingomonas]
MGGAYQQRLAIDVLTRYVICGLDELERQAADTFTHLVSIRDPGTDPPSICASFSDDRLLSLEFDDVIEPAAGKVLPQPEHMAEILRFGRRVIEHPNARTLVHCHGGISRSTAAAIALMAQAEPGADELAIMEMVAEARTLAWPNSRLIGFADGQLGRGGGLSSALTAFQVRRIVAAPHIIPILQKNGRGVDVASAQAHLGLRSAACVDQISRRHDDGLFAAAVDENGDGEARHLEARRNTGFFGAQASGCIFMARSTGRFLMVRRSAMVDQPNSWGTVGGAHHADEDPISSALREAREEIGYAGCAEMVDLYDFTQDTFTYRNFLAVVEREFQPALNWECASAIWVDYGCWPHPLHFGLATLLADAQALQTMKHYSETRDSAPSITEI